MLFRSGARELLALELGTRSYTTLDDSWASPILIKDPKGQGELRIVIEEENSKLNLNVIVLPNGRINQAYYDSALRLFKHLKLPVEPLDAIADWIDEEETPRSSGAEADWYLTQKQPYRPRNKHLLTLDEAKRIKGVAAIFEKIKPFITVYGDQASGSPAAAININTAPKELLIALDERISAPLADRIIKSRKETPFKNPAQLAQVPGMEQISTDLMTRISTKGSVYRIRSDGVVNGVTRSIEAVVRMSGTASTVLYWREY